MKRQNAVHLSGWIIDHTWNVERVGRLEGIVVSFTLRTDRAFFGGHHHVVALNRTALRVLAALEVFRKNAPCPPKNIEDIPFEKLGQYFLEVSLNGWLRGNDVVADEITILNLTASQRREAEELLEQMKASRAV